MIPIKLVSFNTYLISKPFNQYRTTWPEKRARRIRKFLREERADLCFLQEVWGSGLNELVSDPQNDINHDSKEQLPPRRTPILNNLLGSRVQEAIHTLYLHFQQTGGLYDIAIGYGTGSNSKDVVEGSPSCIYRDKHTFTKSRSKSLKGVEATLWSVPQWSPRHELLVFNTHLDPWHPVNRKLQVEEILRFMNETLESIQRHRSHGGTKDWSKTAVLVVGDFNVKADQEEYQSLFCGDEKLQGHSTASRWKDFFAGEQQASYSLENSLVSYPSDCGRIDYVFGVERLGSEYRFLTLTCLSKSIAAQPLSRGKEMSDHFPLLVEFVPDEP